MTLDDEPDSSALRPRTSWTTWLDPPMMRPVFVSLLALYGALQLADLATTIVILRLGGREVNPVLGHLMAQRSALAWIGVKLAVALPLGLACIGAYLLGAWYRLCRLLACAALAAISVLFAAVVATNVQSLLLLRGG
jgi:Domain of unknown function (DUF5658)